MRTLIVTGASGYIGRHLVEAARRDGWHVVAATRRAVGHADAWLSYRLEQPPVPDAFPRAAVIVHLAADTAGTGDPGIEIQAADRLVALARIRDARLLFVSSQTARPDAPTAYGRTKWAIQQRVIDAGGTIVRPGLVYGGVPGGLYATLLRLLRTRKVLPRFVPSPRVQPVHVVDLAAALLVAAQRSDLAGEVLDVAMPEAIAFDEFLRTLAVARFDRAPCFVPVPTFVVRAVVSVLRAAGVGTLAARLASLTGLPAMDTSEDLDRLGVSLRTLSAGVQRRRPDRRWLVAEASTLLRYMLGEAPSLGARRRYVRAVEKSPGGRAVRLPSLVNAWPAALRALDQRSWLRTHRALDSRFALAARIAEASREGASRFLLASGSTNALVVIARLLAIGMLEAAARLGGAPLRASVRARLHDG